MMAALFYFLLFAVVCLALLLLTLWTDREDIWMFDEAVDGDDTLPDYMFASDPDEPVYVEPDSFYLGEQYDPYQY